MAFVRALAACSGVEKDCWAQAKVDTINNSKILTREIGRNELAAIEALHAYVDAQQSYYAMNHRYAQKIVSTPGLKDGLYWPISPGEAPSPLGPAFSPPEPGIYQAPAG